MRFRTKDVDNFTLSFSRKKYPNDPFHSNKDSTRIGTRMVYVVLEKQVRWDTLLGWSWEQRNSRPWKDGHRHRDPDRVVDGTNSLRKTLSFTWGSTMSTFQTRSLPYRTRFVGQPPSWSCVLGWRSKLDHHKGSVVCFENSSNSELPKDHEPYRSESWDATSTL